MKRILKKIISFVLIICMSLTMVLSNVTPRESVLADSLAKITFQFRGGNAGEKYIQVNTNILTSDIQQIDFTSNYEGYKINEEGSSQTVGWFGMNPVGEIYVLTFHYNDTINAGDRFIIKKGSIFCFKDINENSVKYELDKTYIFSYDGTQWTAETIQETETLTLEYKGGNEEHIQYKTNLPLDITVENFLIDANGGEVVQEGKTVGWVEMKNADGTIVLTFHFNEGDYFTKGQSYTLKKDSIFGFKNTDTKYKLAEDITLYFNGTDWQSINKTISLVYKDGSNNQINLSTNLPTGTERNDFLIKENGCYVEESGSYEVGWIGMPKDTEDVRLEFHFNYNFVTGQKYSLPKGAVFGFKDSSKYELDKDYTFWFDGKKWNICTKDGDVEKILVDNQEKTVVKKTTLSAGYTLDSLVQFTGFYNFDLSADDTPITFVGSMYINGVKIENPTVVGYGNNNETICIKNLVLPNNTLTILAGSIIYYGDKAVIIEETFHKKTTRKENTNECNWSDGKTSNNKPVILGDADANLLIDIADLVSIKKAQQVENVNAFNDLVTDGVVDKWDTDCMRKIVAGVIIDMTQYSSNSVNYLLAESNFNGGDDFITFADRPADPTDVNDIKRYKELGFNTSLMTGEYGHYLNMYIDIQTSEEQYELKNGEKELILEKVNSYSNTEKGGNIQIRTNMPLDGQYDDFTMTDTKGYTISFEKSNDAVDVWYFGLNAEKEAADTADNAVYLTPVFSTQNQRGASYTFKAGTKFKINETTTYALTRDYTFTYENDYLKGIENLDAQGLNVWLRTTSNQADYLTDDFAKLIAPYKNIIDGMYMNDEPFETDELFNYSNNKKTEVTVGFDTLGTTMATWFNNNLADNNKYFHVNHVPISSYNHYGTEGLEAINYDYYNDMFVAYESKVLNKVQATSKKKTISFDNYPFGYKTSYLFSSTKFWSEGLEPTYLVNLLIPAQTAKANNNTYNVCIQTYDKTKGTAKYGDDKREVNTKEEVTMQLYSAMACGASMFEYFLYHAQPSSVDAEGNTVEGFDGIIDENGNEKILYNETKQANSEAFPFANILNTFEWQGAKVIKGNKSKNEDAISYVNNANTNLNLVLDDNSDGTLSTYKATNDTLVGYFKKDTYDGYMLANYNDPKQVTTSNEVTLTFTGCNTARVYTSESGKFTTEIIDLDENGSYKFTLKPGGGCFVIPVNATK